MSLTQNQWLYLCGYKPGHFSLAHTFFCAMKKPTSGGFKLTKNSRFFLDFCFVYANDGGTTTHQGSDTPAFIETLQHISMQFVLERNTQLSTLLDGKDFDVMSDRKTVHNLLLVMFNNWYLDKRRANQTQYAKAVASSLNIYNNDEDSELQLTTCDNTYNFFEDNMDTRATYQNTLSYLLQASLEEEAIILHELGIKDIQLPGRRYQLPERNVGYATYISVRDRLRANISSHTA